jgi:hypothetical protein
MRMGPGGAQLVAWTVLAVVNQLLLVTRPLSAPFGARLLHHAYDAGQLVMVGIASFGAVELGRRVLRRFPRIEGVHWVSALGVALACFVVTMLTVENDVTNVAGRHGVPVWLAMFAASSAFAVVLGSATWLRAVRRRGVRVAAASAGVALAVLNAFVLVNDYPALHLALAWLAALLIAQGAEVVLPHVAARPIVRRASLGALATLGVATVVVPPPQRVLRLLFGLSSAVVVPFAARLVPETKGPSLALVPKQVLHSPWFQDRSDVPPVAPTRALTLPEQKLVLFLTIDALRADVLQNRRSLRKLPALASLKANSAYFAQARAPASSTMPSMAAVFTGRYANQLRFTKPRGSSHLSDLGPRLPELLSEAGIATVSLPRLGRIGSESGVGRGFRTEVKRAFPANEVVDRIIAFTRRLDGPTFLYAHFGEPHAPYRGKGTPKQRYLQEVARVDKELGRLVRHLNDSGLSKHTLLVVAADHGEAFGEHGVGNHATIVYEEVARIPLLVWGPGVVPREIGEPVSLLDMTPTFLDLFGLETPGAFMGQSLLPLIAGKEQRLDRPIAICSAGSLDALYVPGGRKKVIFDSMRRTVEVYDLGTDPGEHANLVDSGDEEVARSIEIAKLFFQVHRRRARQWLSD